MKIGFLVRSLDRQIDTYTTTHLAFEALRRGHQVTYANLNHLSYSDKNGVRATVTHARLLPQMTRVDFVSALRQYQFEKSETQLDDYDAIFLRYNPNERDNVRDNRHQPALEFCRLLKSRGVFVVNDPHGLVKASSKFYLSSFPETIRAKTLITRRVSKVKEFIKALRKPAIIKPLAGFGGQDVFFVKGPQEININQIIAAVGQRGYLMVQEFLPAVKQGDKRILLLKGEPIRQGNQVALYRRMSPKGEIRSNIHVGGRRKYAELSVSDAHIVEAIKSRLVADGLYFVGADIVGNKLLEINVYCPGGIHNINELCGMNVGSAIIEDLERQVCLWKTQTLPPHVKPPTSSLRSRSTVRTEA